VGVGNECKTSCYGKVKARRKNFPNIFDTLPIAEIVVCGSGLISPRTCLFEIRRARLLRANGAFSRGRQGA
jgi:hypothetical protein